jgi:hypothetical protein
VVEVAPPGCWDGLNVWAGFEPELEGLGMLSNKLLTCAADGPLSKGLGLRLLKLPIGLVNPLRRPASRHGATTAISSEGESEAVRIAAALSSTEGTLCSSCSVVLERGMRWGFGGCAEVCGGEGDTIGSISRSNMAEDDEWLMDVDGQMN